MAKIATRTLRFNPGTATDIQGYRIRIFPDATFDQPLLNITQDDARKDEFYDLSYSEVDTTLDDNGQISVDVSTLGVAPASDGTYDIGVTSYDDQGSESDALEVADAVFDFTPPDAPSNGEIA